MNPTVAVVIPARGGSVGVPRKNLQLLDGVPLVLIAAANALSSTFVRRVVISTDDEQIASICRVRGLDVLERPGELAQTDSTVDDVLRHAASMLTEDWVVGLQPTVPLLDGLGPYLEAFGQALRDDPNVGAAHVAHRFPHQLWQDGRRLVRHVNRQALTDDPQCPLLETGVVIATRAHYTEGMGVVGVLEDDGAALDVDTYEDLVVAETRARRRRVHLSFVADPQLGTGHVFRVVRLAGALARYHDVSAAPIDYQAPWVDDLLRGHGLSGEADPRYPDLLVLDALDLYNSRVHGARVNEVPTVSLESEAAVADLTINELLPRRFGDTVRSGPRYAVLREEFACLPRRDVADHATKILVTFGGSDPSRLAERVARLPRLGYHDVRVVQGPAARPFLPAGLPPDVEVVSSAHMAEEMLNADLVITGQGRTQYEAAACGTPTITLAANDREAGHVRCPGLLHLGLHAAVSTDALDDAIRRVLDDVALRADMAARGRLAVDGRGVDRILWEIDGLLRDLG